MLRGAKATSPLMELTPSQRCPALQYLDDVDKGGVADMAGLKKGDYLLKVYRISFHKIFNDMFWKRFFFVFQLIYHFHAAVYFDSNLTVWVYHLVQNQLVCSNYLLIVENLNYSIHC